MNRIAIAVVSALVLGLGCGKGGGGGGTGGGNGNGNGNGSGRAAAAPGSVEIYVGGKVVATADAKWAARWAPLAELVPAEARNPKSWNVLEIHTASGRVTTMPEPASTQPDLIAALFPGKDGIDFGMFTAEALSKKGTPTMIETNVVDVRVKFTPGAPGAMGGAGSAGSAAGGSGGAEGGGQHKDDQGPDLSVVTLNIKQPSGAHLLTGEELGKIAKVAPPTGDTETTGWDVASILAAQKIKPTGKVVVSDDTGAAVEIAAGDLVPAKSLAFLKLNKQSQLRFRLFQKTEGGTWAVTGELRGVTQIEIVP
ncbi:MAG: hypothetical protein K8W52_13820 [Deltaproteobacteria bacterium]|nr:hypothetical protein [Deltaproteobacteria bacterium]